MIDLRCGDCLELMKEISDKSIDMILCDLPYGKTNCRWDIIIPFDKLWEQYNRIIKDNGVIVLFGNEPFSSYLRLSNAKYYRYDWYWEKERLTNIMQVKRRAGKIIENICVFYKKQPTYNPQMINPNCLYKPHSGKLGNLVDNKSKISVRNAHYGKYPTQLLKFNRDISKNMLHPTQKPIALMEYLIKTYTNENDLVLDNCMGSGSTGVACVNTGRNFIGIELDENYFNIAKERIYNCLT